MLLSSLTNRIFLAVALLVTLAIGATAAFVTARVTAQAEHDLQRGLVESGAVVARQSEALVERSTLLTRLIADLPKLKAAVATSDPPTVQPLAVEYQAMLPQSSLVVVTDADGRVLASAGAIAVGGPALPALPSVRPAMAGTAASAFLGHPAGILHVLSVPITVGAEPPAVAGTLSVGYLLDETVAADFRGLTGSEIAFSLDGRIRASTLPREAWPAFERTPATTEVSRLTVGRDEFLHLSGPLVPRAAGAPSAAEPMPRVVVIRSRTEQLRFLGPIRTGIAVTALLTVLLAILLSYAVARTVTRPLGAITSVMREVAATGDLTRQIPEQAGVWQDEDARLLASTFNALTHSILRFEKEAALRERLSSLGRLSSVIAHEIRNPLMVVKAAARTLRQPEAGSEAHREALDDLDAEVLRLNRIVTEVLDYARPLTFTWAEADVAAVCREAAQAAGAAEPETVVTVTADRDAVEPLVTDAERLRTVLVNVITNASQATRAARAGAEAGRAEPGPVQVHAAARPGGGAAIVVRDRGAGIDAAHLPRVFEPYFTTRRGGTGLGLAISRNIVEGLGGTITIRSDAAAGTELRIELPARPPAAAPGGTGPGPVDGKDGGR